MRTQDGPIGDLAADTLVVGSSAGSWRVESLLGRGGMGDVYAVVHERIGKHAALKIMHRRFAETLDAERVALEGWVVNQVRHPRIIDIFEHGVFDGRPYLVMEKLEGMTLADYLCVHRVTPDEAITILLQLCDALAAAHEAGVVHRDVKPDNIFVTSPEGAAVEVKLLDWSIAKVDGDTSRRTIEGQIVGTPEFVSPEQATGRPSSPMTDVYALGVLAYLLFLRRLPFAAVGRVEMVQAHVTLRPTVPTELWPEIPGELSDLLLAMLAKMPGARPTLGLIALTLNRLASARACVAPPGKAIAIVSKPVRDEDAAVPKRSVGANQPISTAEAGVAGGTLLMIVLSVAVAWSEPAPQRPAPGFAEIASLPIELAPRPAQPQPLPITPPATVVEPAAPGRDIAAPPVAATGPREAAGGGRSRRPITSPGSVATSVTAPAREPSESPPSAPTAAALTTLYIAVGHRLEAEGRQISMDDLWTSYRMIRVFDALRTEEQRSIAYRALNDIESRVSARIATAK